MRKNTYLFSVKLDQRDENTQVQRNNEITEQINGQLQVRLSMKGK